MKMEPSSLGDKPVHSPSAVTANKKWSRKTERFTLVLLIHVPAVHTFLILQFIRLISFFFFLILTDLAALSLSCSMQGLVP